MSDYDKSSWLAWAMKRFGPSKITPQPGGYPLGGFTRWAWVWFPGNINHGLHLDVYSTEHIEILIWGPERRLERTETTMPTDQQMIASMRIIWDGPEAFERTVVTENW